MRRLAVVTVSDGVVAGTREDKSGPAVEQYLHKLGYTTDLFVVDDDRPRIEKLLVDLCDQGYAAIFTTGGTGVAMRDVTPEATRAVLDREIPGLAEQMRRVSVEKIRTAMLSRAVVGLRGRVLIVNLPGSTRGAIENLDAIMDVVPHVFDLVEGRTEHAPQPQT